MLFAFWGVGVFAAVRDLGPEGFKLWGLMLTLDLPVSLITLVIEVLLAEWAIEMIGVTGYYVFGYGAFIAVVGGIQYWFIGKLLVYLIRLRRRKIGSIPNEPLDDSSGS